MDLDFFQLTHDPFSLAPYALGPFWSRTHRAALQALRAGITERQGFVTVSGAVGLGKTTILRAYLAHAEAQRVRTLSLAATSLSLKDMLLLLCREFGLEAETRDVAVMADRLRRHLLGAAQQGQNVALMIDDAQNLPVPTLWNLCKLSDLLYASSIGRLVQIVLVGRPEFVEICNRPALRQLKQRFYRPAVLAPLSRKESLAYLRYRLTQATLRQTPVFTHRALTRITKHGQGNPLRLNVLCAGLLRAGSATRHKPVSAGMTRHMLETRQEKIPTPLWQWGVVSLLGFFFGISLGESLVRRSTSPEVPSSRFDQAYVAQPSGGPARSLAHDMAGMPLVEAAASGQEPPDTMPPLPPSTWEPLPRSRETQPFATTPRYPCLLLPRESFALSHVAIQESLAGGVCEADDGLHAPAQVISSPEELAGSLFSQSVVACGKPQDVCVR